MDYILFSPIGDTDPVRGGFDGPMLHIVRHYKPKKAYLFFTKEMEKRDRGEGEYANAENCYEKSIHCVCPDCKVEEKIYSGIEDPSDFDAFNFGKYLADISEKNPDSQILLNISSATPQIIIALCLQTITNKAVLHPIQVKTPEKSSNYANHHFDPKKDDIINEVKNELFENEPNAEKRCNEPDLLGLKKSMLNRQIKALTEKCEYKGAYDLLNENKSLFNNGRLELLLKHAYCRSLPNEGEAERAARELDMLKQLYPVQNNAAKLACEYYITAKLRRTRGELTDFILRVIALAEHLMRYEIGKAVAGLNTIADESKKGEWRLNEKRAEASLPGLKDRLSQEFTDYRYNQVMGIRVWEIIAAHIGLNGYERLLCVREYRNDAAHNLESITEKDLASIKCASTVLEKDIERLIKRIYGNYIKEQIFTIFDGEINKMIYEELNKPPERQHNKNEKRA